MNVPEPKTAEALQGHIKAQLEQIRENVMPELPHIESRSNEDILNDFMKRDGIPRRARRAYLAAKRNKTKKAQRQ